MAIFGRSQGGGRRQPPLPLRQTTHSNRPLWRTNRYLPRKTFRIIILILVFIALLPPVFFHFRLRRFHQMRLKECGWLSNPPLVCAHGGDSVNAFPNTMAAYQLSLSSQVDCIEIDVSRSLDGVLFALHDRDLQRITGNRTSRVGHLSMKEIKQLNVPHHLAHGLYNQTISTLEDALMFVSGSVRQVILDAKVGPPSYEKGLADDILSTVYGAHCKNCVVWAKSDSLARDVIKFDSEVMVGYIVMVDPNTGVRTNLLRMKGAGVVGVYHELIDERLVRILHGSSKKVFAWTVDAIDSMRKMLLEHVDAVVTNKPNVFQGLMQDIRTQCLEEGFSFGR